MRRNAVCVLAILLAMTAIAGCGDSKSPSVFQPETKTVTQPKINLDVVVTLSNHTYIPLNIVGSPNRYVQVILVVLDAFEKAHPNLKITNWHIEKQQMTFNNGDYTFGLWVDHELRAK